MKFGIQIFLFRDYCTDKEGIFNTIKRITKIGYDAIEFHGSAVTQEKELKRAIADSGMTPLNVHIDFDVWRKDWKKGIDNAAEAGFPAVTFGWIPPEHRTDEVYAWVKDTLPSFVQGCKERGLDIYYHHHDFEFGQYDGKLLLDWLLADTDDVKIQLDTFWVKYAGFDPLEAMDKYKEKLELLHIKDYVGMRPELQCCPLGQGDMDNQPILHKALEFGIEYIISDLDNSTKDVFQTAEESLAYLKQAI